MYDVSGRERKARTMVAVLEDYIGSSLKDLNLLDVGGSSGIIDNYLSDHLGSVIGIDIDTLALEYAQKTYIKSNLKFSLGDTLNLQFPDRTFDVVVCSQVYEHVPNPRRMLDEIFRVLKPGGLCYFSANNRLMWNEPHYNLPLLSVIPRPLAHIYIRLAGKADYYYEYHFTYWELRELVRGFTVHDYTLKIVLDPHKYFTDYMIKPGSIKAILAGFIIKNIYWLIPGYIWLLQKPSQELLGMRTPRK